MKKVIVALVVAALLVGGVMAVSAQEEKAVQIQPFFDPGGGRT